VVFGAHQEDSEGRLVKSIWRWKSQESSYDEDQRSPSPLGQDADYKEACDDLGEEFDLARAPIEARAGGAIAVAAGPAHKTSQSTSRASRAARCVRPQTLERFARATRTRLRIALEAHASR
jgi:hypothetical protein